jgi:RND family efflux transporter MFP subunit
MSSYSLFVQIRKYIKHTILLSIFSVSLVCNAEMPGAVSVITTAVKTHDFYEKFTAIGQSKSENSKTYYSKVDGTIDSISIIQGKDVLKDDVLLTIDSAIANATISKAKAAFESAKSIHERDLSLLEKKIISKEVSDKSKVTLEIARADLVTAMNTYDNMILKAPFDGYVGVVHARTGDDVKDGDYLFSLIAKGNKTIFIELPEILFGKIDNDSDVFAYDINNQKAQGSVLAVSNYLNDNGTITAKLAFSPETKIMHGSYVETEITFNKHSGLALPERTVLKNNNGNFVYMISDDNIVKQVYIKTATRTGDMIEVIADELKEGDMVILSGLTKVYDGAKVAIIEEPLSSDDK